MAYLSKYILQKKNVLANGLDVIFVITMVLLSYAISDKLGSNAYLSVYLFGLYLGNTRINTKKAIASFYRMTSLVQILIFFIIGLLSFPETMPSSFMLS